MIADTLTHTGQHDAAVKLIQSQLYPSWGYEVKNGATTIWERWNSYTEEYGFGGPDGKLNAAMNSFSYCAFRAVTEWMMSTLAGIKLHPHFPSPDAYKKDPKTISHIKAHHDSPPTAASPSTGKNKPTAHSSNKPPSPQTPPPPSPTQQAPPSKQKTQKPKA